MLIDLRSDTVTKPTAAMREAIARAEVGDDVYGEDPTVIALEERVAGLLGKEAALFVPSGTMANQIAIAVHTRPGEEVLVGQGAHCMIYEGGAGSALCGVQMTPIGSGGLYTAAEVEAAIQPDNVHNPRTALVCVENTHNRAGGRIFAQAAIEQIATVVRRAGLPLHLDGARLWNVHVATGKPLRELAAPFDSVAVCLSKGLGAPVGSLVCGTRAFIGRAQRRRKMLGGGMRQAGIIAAAGLYALDHHLERLRVDHEHARLFADKLATVPGVTLDPSSVESNIVIWELAPGVAFDAEQFVSRAKERGLLLNSISRRRLRAVTHLDVDRTECERAVEVAREIMRA